MPFSGENKVFFVLNNRKKTKPPKKQHNKNNKNKQGGFRAKWGGPSGHLTWPLNPPKKTNKKNKTKKQKKTKKNKEGLGPSEVALRATSPDP